MKKVLNFSLYLSMILLLTTETNCSSQRYHADHSLTLDDAARYYSGLLHMANDDYKRHCKTEEQPELMSYFYSLNDWCDCRILGILTEHNDKKNKITVEECTTFQGGNEDFSISFHYNKVDPTLQETEADFTSILEKLKKHWHKGTITNGIMFLYKNYQFGDEPILIQFLINKFKLTKKMSARIDLDEHSEETGKTVIAIDTKYLTHIKNIFPLEILFLTEKRRYLALCLQKLGLINDMIKLLTFSTYPDPK